MALWEFYETIESQGVEVPELELPEKPYFLAGTLEKFFDMHRSRGQGFSGPQPLTYRDILDWQDYTGWETSMWEWGVIRRIDAVYLNVVSQQS